jgi:hypothetical protein
LKATAATSKGKGGCLGVATSKIDTTKATTNGDSTKGASKGRGDVTSKIDSLTKGDSNKGASKGHAVECSRKVAASIVANVSTPVRIACRHGRDCYRDGAEHRNQYSHPGDDDWDEACKRSSQAPKADGEKLVCSVAPWKGVAPSMPRESSATSKGKSMEDVRPKPKAKGKRHCCQYGANCLTRGKEHRQVFAHPGDADWVDPAGDSSSSTVNSGAKRTDDSLEVMPADVSSIRISPAWLNMLTSTQVEDLSADLRTMAGIFKLDKAALVDSESSRIIELAARSLTLLDEAKHDLIKDDGLLAFYESQVSFSEITISPPAPETPEFTQETLESEPTPEHSAAEPEASGNEKEMRTDPDDGQAYTFERIFHKYQDTYKPREIKQYWQTMVVASGTAVRIQKW